MTLCLLCLLNRSDFLFDGGVSMRVKNVVSSDRFLDRYSKGALRISLFVLFLLAAVMLALPAAVPAQVSVGVSVTFGPPALPIYVQPLCPGPNYIWVPGYWAWDPDYGYYWVPGMWERAPFVGALWTPGYWGWNDGFYVWYDGYWGPVVGFYGGINYGFGYHGYGYVGGHWRGGDFYYNRTVNNINITKITNVYTEKVSTVRPGGVSFNGGSGGTTARPTSEQLAAAREKRVELTDFQKEQMRLARADPRLRATENRGRPAVAATAKPGEFSRGVIKATRASAPYKAPLTARKAEPGKQIRAPKPGAEKRAPATAPERAAPKTQRKEVERRVTESRPTPKRSEMTQPMPPQGRSKNPSEMRPPMTAPARVAPGAQQREAGPRVRESRPVSERQETMPPISPRGRSRDER